MKAVDANVLLYAVNRRAPHHAVARDWLDAALNGPETVGFAWVVVLAFIRLSTNPGVSPRPISPDRACELVSDWLAQPAAVVVEPTDRHLPILRGLLQSAGTAANLVPDAHLASLAIEHDADVVSFDTDFARFDGLRWHKPTSS
jgi:uncharacterized protein